MKAHLSSNERKVVQAVNAFAFVNPFSRERDKAEADFLEATDAIPASHSARFDPFFHWIERLPETKRNYLNFAPPDRELIRTTFLFEIFYRYINPLDELISAQLEKGDKPSSVSFGAECIVRLEMRGFTTAEAMRYFGIFYQLRRAHYFIVRGLKGLSPCMKEFRRRLWNNVFTNDVRWYERHLWNRMEDFSTLLLGETGSGKGAAAAAIGRSGFIPYLPEKREFAESFNRSFVSINLAEFPETLIEAELFGYRKGAFTGAVQSQPGVFERCSPHGAIFLDEIGEVKTAIQVKLLQVLQERTFSPVGSQEKMKFRGRVISATNRLLADLRAERLFRDDFFYRISSDVIEVPPLRQRITENPEELDLLLATIVARLAGEDSSEVLRVVRERLAESPGRNYAWPGNVRELEQAVRRILVTGHYEPQKHASGTKCNDLLSRFERVELTAKDLLSEYSQMALAMCGTRAAAARRLGVDARTLLKHLRLPNDMS